MPGLGTSLGRGGATTTLMDLVGPAAQSQDLPLEKFFRDAKIYQIFEGTAQVQRLVVSRMQRAEYSHKIAAATEVLQQAPGNAPGDRADDSGDKLSEAAKSVATA